MVFRQMLRWSWPMIGMNPPLRRLRRMMAKCKRLPKEMLFVNQWMHAQKKYGNGKIGRSRNFICSINCLFTSTIVSCTPFVFFYMWNLWIVIYLRKRRWKRNSQMGCWRKCQRSRTWFQSWIRLPMGKTRAVWRSPMLRKQKFIIFLHVFLQHMFNNKHKTSYQVKLGLYQMLRAHLCAQVHRCLGVKAHGSTDRLWQVRGGQIFTGFHSTQWGES